MRKYFYFLKHYIKQSQSKSSLFFYICSSLDSYWLIDTGPSPTTVYIKFNSFRLESSVTCAYDYVKVYAGRHLMIETAY